MSVFETAAFSLGTAEGADSAAAQGLLLFKINTDKLKKAVCRKKKKKTLFICKKYTFLTSEELDLHTEVSTFFKTGWSSSEAASSFNEVVFLLGSDAFRWTRSPSLNRT